MRRRSQEERLGDAMGKTGRTRARSRDSQHSGQRQPDFSTLTNESTMEGQRTNTPAGQDVPQPENEPLDRFSGIHTPPEEQEGSGKEEGEQRQDSKRRRGDIQEGNAEAGVADSKGAHDSEHKGESDEESEGVSMSEESADSGGRKGEEKERRSYWKEVEHILEMECSARLEDARVAARAAIDTQ
eukprot:4786770-Pleurochrysis_carterae.AAC.1